MTAAAPALLKCRRHERPQNERSVVQGLQKSARYPRPRIRPGKGPHLIRIQISGRARYFAATSPGGSGSGCDMKPPVEIRMSSYQS